MLNFLKKLVNRPRPVDSYKPAEEIKKETEDIVDVKKASRTIFDVPLRTELELYSNIHRDTVKERYKPEVYVKREFLKIEKELKEFARIGFWARSVGFRQYGITIDEPPKEYREDCLKALKQKCLDENLDIEEASLEDYNDKGIIFTLSWGDEECLKN